MLASVGNQSSQIFLVKEGRYFACVEVSNGPLVIIPTLLSNQEKSFIFREVIDKFTE